MVEVFRDLSQLAHGLFEKIPLYIIVAYVYEYQPFMLIANYIIRFGYSYIYCCHDF